MALLPTRENMNLDIVRIMRGEDTSLQLSDRERETLGFVLDLCGEQLSNFLLTGLGEHTASRQRRFTITFTRPEGTLNKREVNVIAYTRGEVPNPSLPRRKEPLVMVALLRLLIDEHKMSSFTMAYEQEEVLDLLGWDLTEDTVLALDEAVRRYNSLHYKWALSKEELSAKGLAFYNGEASFITGYAYETDEVEGEVMRVSNEVTYAREFVRELIGRSLFGINWDKVGSMKYTDY